MSPTSLWGIITGNATTIDDKSAIDIELGINDASLVLVTSTEAGDWICDILLRRGYSQDGTEDSQTHR